MSAFKVFKKHPEAVIPVRADPGAAGYDLYSVEDAVIPSHSQHIIDTGIILDFPSSWYNKLSCYARIAPRSGLAAKYSIDVLAGVVDSSYRDTIKVILYNHGEHDYKVSKNDRIAQLIFEQIFIPTLSEVSSVDMLSSSERGQGGFGSTGV